jgi:hypothetical protein
LEGAYHELSNLFIKAHLDITLEEELIKEKFKWNILTKEENNNYKFR